MSDNYLNTPLSSLHTELGAKMVPFAGYNMPVQYPLGVRKEHLHTREQAGLFDVSHMGQIKLTGKDAAAAVETIVPVDIIGLQPVTVNRRSVAAYHETMLVMTQDQKIAGYVHEPLVRLR